MTLVKYLKRSQKTREVDMLNWKDYVKMRIDYLTLFSEGSPRKCWQDQAPATPRVYHLHKATFPGFPSFPTSLF